jgi:DNA-binding response OmpR family regulator
MTYLTTKGEGEVDKRKMSTILVVDEKSIVREAVAQYLRQKTESDPERPRYIKTAWGVGYKFEP